MLWLPEYYRWSLSERYISSYSRLLFQRPLSYLNSSLNDSTDIPKQFKTFTSSFRSWTRQTDRETERQTDRQTEFSNQSNHDSTNWQTSLCLIFQPDTYSSFHIYDQGITKNCSINIRIGWSTGLNASPKFRLNFSGLEKSSIPLHHSGVLQQQSSFTSPNYPTPLPLTRTSLALYFSAQNIYHHVC